MTSLRPFPSFIKRSQSLEILSNLPEPQRVFAYLLFLTDTPRPSKKLDTARAAVLSLVEKFPNIEEARVDTAGNLYIRKTASHPEFASRPGVILQSHLDVVLSKNDDVTHDFEKDPVDVIIDGEILKARGTTLGADNGIGVAESLAILESTDIVHGPLEVLITADEEDDMYGAEFCEQSMLRGKYLLNLDSEEEYAVCIGCAGGAEHWIKVPVADNSHATATSGDIVFVRLSGLRGGHSGCDIHEPRGNAIVWLARALSAAYEMQPFQLFDIQGGTAPNALPREASAVLYVCKGQGSALVDVLKAASEQICAEYGQEFEPECQWTIATDVGGSRVADLSRSTAISLETTRQALDTVATIPHGVLRMSAQVEGLVETSTNLSKIRLDANELYIHMFARSSRDSQLEAFKQRIEAISRLAGASVSPPIAPFPGWQPDNTSPVLQVVKAATVKVMGQDPRVYAVHAGLECGLLQKRYPELDCVSFGPQIENAHSPDELLRIPSVQRFHDLTMEVLRSLAQA